MKDIVTKPSKRVLITGCTGSLGQHLCRVLAQAGYSVRGFDLRGDTEGVLRSLSIPVVVGDIADYPAVFEASKGMDVAINCAVLLPGREGLGWRRYYETNVTGAVNVLKAASQLGLERIIHISTVGVRVTIPNGISTDEAPYASASPRNYYHRSKIEAEKRLIAMSQGVDVGCIILRSSSIYGPGMDFRWPELVHLIRRGKMRVISGGRTPYCLVHVNDLTRAILLALQGPKDVLSGERITITSPESLTISQIVNFIADYYHVKRPGSLPYWPSLIASYVLEWLPDSLKTERLRLLRSYNIKEYHHGIRFDATKAERLLGFRAEVQFEQGMSEMLAGWEA